MDSYRMKAKIGGNEFDAEGPADLVRADYEAFIAAIRAGAAKTPDTATDKEPDIDTPSTATPPRPDGNAATDAALTRIMRVDKRTVSLTATPSSVEDAVLLLLYGQRVLRNNESPTGSEVVDGIETTGGLDIGRSDRLFEKIARNGDVIMIGERRGKRYRLTNAGITKARQIAASMLALVA